MGPVPQGPCGNPAPVDVQAGADDDKTEPPSAIPLGMHAYSGPRDINVPPVPPVVPHRDNMAVIWAATPGPLPRQSPAGIMRPCISPEPKDAGRKSKAPPMATARTWP